MAGGLGALPTVTDSLVQSAETAIGRPTATARRLVEASISANTHRGYASALQRLDAWLAGQTLDDAALAAYLAEFHDAGRAASSAAMAVAAARFRARLAGQARPFGVSDLAAVLATCHRPRRRGRAVESDQVALERGRVDAVIAGLLFMAGMRRSEVSALRWADVVDSTDGDGILVAVRRSKINQESAVNDVRFVKNRVARAIRTLRAVTEPGPGRSRGPVLAADDRAAVYGRGPSRRPRAPRNRPLRTGRAGKRAHQPRGHCQLVEGSALLPREIDAPDRFQQAHVTASHSTNARVRSRRW